MTILDGNDRYQRLITMMMMITMTMMLMVIITIEPFFNDNCWWFAQLFHLPMMTESFEKNFWKVHGVTKALIEVKVTYSWRLEKSACWQLVVCRYWLCRDTLPSVDGPVSKSSSGNHYRFQLEQKIIYLFGNVQFFCWWYTFC